MRGTSAIRIEDRECDWQRAHRALSRLASERAAADAEEGRSLLAAQRTAAHVLEELVAGKHPGDEPAALGLPAAKRHVLRFEVEAETFALFREALSSLRRCSNEALNDDSALLSMARHVLGGPKDDGRASYQISLSVCPACSDGRQHASGELVSVGADVVAMAQCDGQQLGQLPTSAANENASPDTTHAIETPVVDPTLPSPDPQATGAHPADAHAAAPPAGDDHPSKLAPRRSAPVGVRAKQTLPPALRRAVLLRDQRRCRAPGCRNATFVDVHHIELRSEGGRNELANLLTLCGAHHRAAHRGQLVIDRDPRGDVRFRHADGSEYGQPLQPQALGTQAKVFSALRQLGFAEREVRALLAELQKDDALRGASVQQLLRESLRKIRLPGIHR